MGRPPNHSWISPAEREAFTRRSTTIALLVLGSELAAFLLCTVVAVAPLPWLLNVFFAGLASLFIGAMFTIAHDAGHQVFTPHSDFSNL